MAIDGKGVPVIKKEKGKPRKRLKKGEKAGKKKMTTVTAIYTIDRNERTVEDVIKEVDSANIKGENEKKQAGKKRPKHKNKVVRATMEGKEKAFDELKQKIEQRDPEKKKERVALVDGEHKLRQMVGSVLSGFLIILDLFHVLEYLWEAAHVFHKDGSDEAQRWVTVNLRLLLTGRVQVIIANLKHKYNVQRLSASKRKTLKKVIRYLVNGQEHMKYDEYLANGYPIGSGVVEGACRNLVKDRMELAGMRWTEDGADSVLQMRSVDINGIWEEFWHFHVDREQQRLYQNYSDKGRKPAKMCA